MSTLEFQARVKDGMIEVPEEYRNAVTNGDAVKVILLRQSVERKHPRQRDLFDELTENPIQVIGFVPLSREEAHDRTL